MRVKVKAIAFGTRAVPSGGIVHTNPKGSDPRAKEPIIEDTDIPTLLEDPALIEDPGENLKAADGVVDLTTAGATVAYVDEKAAARVGEIEGIDSEAGPAPSGLTHREATHYPDSQGVRTGRPGIAVDQEAGPAPAEGPHGKEAVDQNVTAAGTTVEVREESKKGPGRPKKSES